MMAIMFTKLKSVYILLYMLVVCSFVKFVYGALARIEDEPAHELHHLEAVQGTKAKLPCDIKPLLPGDKMNIAIWLKDTSTSPIFTFDSRGKQLEQAKSWMDESILGDRATFRYLEKPAKLIINNVKDSDGGIYHCRVDFQKSPTRNVKFNLTVIIPPEKVSILDEKGVHIPHYILGPYNEGASINITCIATGGRPIPTVTWWLENERLGTTHEILSERRVRNILYLQKLERKHLHSVFTCQATNNHLVTPISSSVTLELNLRPLWVKLIGENRPLSAENTYELSCEVVGARPSPTITWWKGSVQMKNTRETVSPDGNTTTSVLTFIPTIDDEGKYLSCRGQQPLIRNSGIEDGWRLFIYHVPLVSLELGTNINSSRIMEGMDIYFDCNIKSNPWIYKVSWRHNGKILFTNPSSGIIVSNQSLVLQAVTRNRAGLYTCVGSNQEGDGESNAIQIDVKFAPICRPGQTRVYGLARQENARISCELEANPVAELSFSWKFNNSAETADISQSEIYTEGTRSVAMYTPITEMDYGTLLCWGKNQIGVQRDPCIFYVTPAGKPDSLSNCTILNQTAESLHVECIEGFDGGLQQEFIMEIYDMQTRKLVRNVTSQNPVFTVDGLESGLGLAIGFYAVNEKGRSDVVYLQAYTLKSAEKQRASTLVFMEVTPVLGVLMGIVASIILISTTIVVVIRIRKRHNHNGKDYDESELSPNRRRVAGYNDETSTEPLSKTLNESIDSLEEKNPDIIPQNNGEEYQDDRNHQNNANPHRFYSKMNPNTFDSTGLYELATKDRNEVTYAELLHTNQQTPVIYHQKAIPMSMMRRQEPTVYAQIEISKRMPNCLQPLNPPHPSYFQSMHRPYVQAYVPRSIREDKILHDVTVNAETPLLNPPDNNSHHRGSCI